MNFKKWYTLLCLVFAIALPFACSDDKDGETEVIAPITEEFKLEEDLTELLFKQESSSITLKLSTNLSWTAVSSSNWCTLSKISGSGNDEIVVSVTANTTVEERRCQVMLKGGTHKMILEVVQLGEKVQTIVFVGGVEIPDGEGANRAVLDFEQQQYRINVLSNVDNNISFASVWWLQYREVSLAAYSSVEDYVTSYDIMVADNEDGSDRSTTFTIAQKQGDYTRTITIEQVKGENFVRVFNDTLYIGSHYNVLDIDARTNIDWDYEIVGNPAWVSNWRKRNMPGNKGYALGVRSRLLADVERNTGKASREFEVKFKFNSLTGEPQSQSVKVIQLPNNSISSDSLVLIDLVRCNSNPKVGLEIGWVLGTPVTTWTGVVFEKIGGEQRLTKLEAAGCLMTHELTASIANLSELTELNLMKNYLYGSLPEEMSRLTNLQKLNVSANYTDIPEESPSLTKTGIENIPAEIFEKCTRLKDLDISMNRLKSIPASIGNLVDLESLICGIQPELTELPVEELGKLNKLTSLEISDIGSWKGDFFNFIFDMPRLKRVSFFRMNFQETAIEDKFDQLPDLEYFNCTMTDIGGTFPKSIVNCKNLTQLLIQQTSMGGELPANLPDLKKLQIIVLSGNNFTGEVPASYAAFGNEIGKDYSRGNYTLLFLHDNRLTGEIPDEVKTCKMWNKKNWEPEIFICPQQAGYGFTNCSEQQ